MGLYLILVSLFWPQISNSRLSFFLSVMFSLADVATILSMYHYILVLINSPTPSHRDYFFQILRGSPDY